MSKYKRITTVTVSFSSNVLVIPDITGASPFNNFPLYKYRWQQADALLALYFWFRRSHEVI